MKVDLAQLKTSWGGVLIVLVDKLNMGKAGYRNWLRLSLFAPFQKTVKLVTKYHLDERIRN